jgi:hypothetical protein
MRLVFLVATCALVLFTTPLGSGSTEAQAGPEHPDVGILITELADGYRAQGRLTRPSRCIGARSRSSSTRPGGITRWC